jgi:hypothetical protein
MDHSGYAVRDEVVSELVRVVWQNLLDDELRRVNPPVFRTLTQESADELEATDEERYEAWWVFWTRKTDCFG